MRRVVKSNRYLISYTTAKVEDTNSVSEQQSSISISREQAQKIIARGQFTANGIVIHLFDNRLSRLPQITTEELRDTDFVIHANKGTIDAGKYGPSWVLEVGSTPAQATHSWLVNCASVPGKQLADHKDFPLMVHLRHVTPNEGNEYDSLGMPEMFASVLRDADDDTDLPF